MARGGDVPSDVEEAAEHAGCVEVGHFHSEGVRGSGKEVFIPVLAESDKGERGEKKTEEENGGES